MSNWSVPKIIITSILTVGATLLVWSIVRVIKARI